MAIPTYDQLLRPVLELAAKDNITRQTATAAMVAEFKLTEEEQSARIKSGALYIRNRTGWAMSHLTKGKLIEKVTDQKFTYRVTEKGREYLKTHSGPITPSDLKEIDGLIEAWEEASKKKAETKNATQKESKKRISNSNDTPEELIDEATTTLNESLRAELLDQLATVNPHYFEQVVIDLLSAMGYGGFREDAARVTQKSNDGGIDGIINEDRLGLDVIYIQAKRHQATIGRKEIQSFVGALAGKQANKGVFITTSDFKKNAVDYAETVTQKVILINGPRLADLMIEHDIGVSTQRTISIKRIDTDYFEES